MYTGGAGEYSKNVAGGTLSFMGNRGGGGGMTGENIIYSKWLTTTFLKLFVKV